MNLRLLLAIMSLSVMASHPTVVSAQTPQRFLRLQVAYDKPEHHTDEATEYIDATNVIGGAANVQYKAGQAVTLSPGFSASLGTIFSAQVELGTHYGDNNLRVTAFPNPFVQATTIEYYLPKDGKVSLWVVDEQGKQVRQLIVEQDLPAGTHSYEWKAESTTSGVYVPVVSSNHKQAAIRVIKK
jgi:hypothetical protein